MSLPVLWHFRFSHFNEKARWALDWKGIPHVRRSLVPGLHIPRVLWMTGQKAVPVLVLDGETVHDSTRIIERLERLRPDPPLYPADPAERRRALGLEEHFDEELGPHVRRAAFHALLPQTEYACALMTMGAGPATKLFYRAFFPLLRPVMMRDMRIDDEGAALGRQKTAAALDRIEAEVGPTGYLVGDRFSVADLTAAALLAPLVLPPEFPYPPPTPYPQAAAGFVAALASRPAFRWVLDIYRRHRGRSAEVAAAA
jgi:glutathione S-transferase